MKKGILIFAMGVFLCAATDLRAATTWLATGNVSSSANTAANWSPAVVPQNVDVIIDGETGNNSTVNLDLNATVNNLTVTSGDQLIVNGGCELTIDGRSANVIVDNQGAILLDPAANSGHGLYVEGNVTWTNNGLVITGTQNYNQFKIQPGACLTVDAGTEFNFYCQAYGQGNLINNGTFKIGGMFLGGSGTQSNGGTMEFRGRNGINLVNHIAAQAGDLTLSSINQEQDSTVEGGFIHFANGNYDMHRMGFGYTLNLLGVHTTNLETGRTLSMIRRSSFNLDAGGSYDFEGLLTMDVLNAGTHDNGKMLDCSIIAKSGNVNMAGNGSITMTVGILTHVTLGDLLKSSVLTGETATDALVNNLAGGISGAGNIGNDTSSFINNASINATDATYPIVFDPASGGNISNYSAGRICATGAAGLVFKDGPFFNAGTVEVLPGSQALFTNSLVLNNDLGTLAFTLGASNTQTPVINVVGDVTLSGTLSVNVLTGYSGNQIDRYDVITCTGNITDSGLALSNVDPDREFVIFDNGSSDGTFTIGLKPPSGAIFLIK